MTFCWFIVCMRSSIFSGRIGIPPRAPNNSGRQSNSERRRGWNDTVPPCDEAGRAQCARVAWLQQRACCALVASLVLWPAVVTAQAAPGVTFQVLYTFLGPPNDGQFPPARLTLDSAVP